MFKNMVRSVKLRPPSYLPYFISVCSIGTIIYVICNKIGEYPGLAEPVILHWAPVEQNISCHSSKHEDSLPSASDPKFAPLSKAIFFHETSCRGGLDSRQACSVESAARAHPAWGVYLLFSSPVTNNMLKKSCLAKLLEFPNVKIARIHASEYSKDTVVHSVITKKLKYSTHPIEHTADIMRILTLNKWGGIYLDLDEIVAKPFDSLPYNWIAKESPMEFSTGVMGFAKDKIGQNITKAVLKEISDTFDPQGWTVNGPMALYRVLRRICPAVINKPGFCGGVSIFSHELFYPIHYSWAHLYFQDDAVIKTDTPYTFHVWNLLTKIYSVSKNSLYAKLAQQYCPTIYNMYGSQFGV